MDSLTILHEHSRSFSEKQYLIHLLIIQYNNGELRREHLQVRLCVASTRRKACLTYNCLRLFTWLCDMVLQLICSMDFKAASTVVDLLREENDA
jgi:hypothetical protein